MKEKALQLMLTVVGGGDTFTQLYSSSSCFKQEISDSFRYFAEVLHRVQVF